MSFEGIAYAQTDKTAGASQQVIFTTVIPLVFLFAIFYFLLIRPQAKKASDLQKMLAALKRNDDPIRIIPRPGTQVHAGDLLVAIGDRAGLDALVKAE